MQHCTAIILTKLNYKSTERKITVLRCLAVKNSMSDNESAQIQNSTKCQD